MASETPLYHRPFSMNVNPKTSREPCITGLVIVLIAIGTTIARLLSRRYKNLGLGLDDYFILAAVICTIIILIEQWVSVFEGGLGYHVNTISSENLMFVFKLLLPYEIIYGTSMAMVKLSFLAFYLRIFGAEPGFRKKIYIAAVVVVLWLLHVILETFLLCRPFRYNWDTSINGTCGNRSVVFVVAGATNMVTDLIIFALPIPTIWRLKMTTGRKLGVAAIFALGAFVSVISIIRLVYLLAIDFTDATYTLPGAFLWSILEPGIAIINANLPILRPFFKHLFPRFFSSISDKYHSYNRRGTTTTGGQYVDPQKHFERVTEGTYPLYPVGKKGLNTQISQLGAEEPYNPDDKPGYMVNVRSGRRVHGRSGSPEDLEAGKSGSKYPDPELSVGDASSQENISMDQVTLPEDGQIAVKTEWNITSVSR